MTFVPKLRSVPRVASLITAGGSNERARLQDALDNLKSQVPVQVPLTIGSQEVSGNLDKSQANPSDHASVIANYSEASAEQVNQAIERALEAKPAGENMAFTNRAAIFLRAAELVAAKYRYDIMAATMLGQDKNIWQAEIDAAAKTADF
ncbi:hypothetical protein ABHI18_009812 [Aspergillus niger]